MDWDLVTIFVFIIIITSIVGGAVNGIVRKVLEYKRSEAGTSLLHRSHSGDVQALTERTQMIEDRLRVLERIATDRGHLLSEEIEALRDDMSKRDRAIPLEKTQERA